MSTPTARAWLPAAAAATTVLLWGSAFVAIRYLGETVEPGALSLGRLLVATLTLGLVLVWRERGKQERDLRREVAPDGRWPTRREWPLLLLCGVTWFGIYNIALNASEQRIDAGTAAMLIQIGPLLIPLLAAAFLGERLTGWLLLGLGIGFAGVVVIGVATSSGTNGDLLGVLLALLAAATYAVGVVAQKPLMRRLQPLEVTLLACAIGAAVCLPFAADLVRTLAAADASTLLWIGYLGVFPTAIAFTTWAYALARSDASRLAILTFLVPVIAVVIAWLLLDEVPPAAAFAGGALCVLGVLLSRRRPRLREQELVTPA